MFDFLDKVQEPYVLETNMASNKFLNEIIKMYGDEIKKSYFLLDGNKMKTWKELFVEFQNVMKFPDYFGHNLDAFDECMQDLHDWLYEIDKYILFIENSKNLLINEPNKDEEKLILIDKMFKFIGEELSEPIIELYPDDVNARKAYPFHIILA